MASTVIHANLQAFLPLKFAELLASREESFAQGVEVVAREPLPGEDFPERLLIVNVGGGTDTSVVTREVDVGLSVLAGTMALPKDADDLIQLVLALAQLVPAVERGNPVAAVMNTVGPFVADENQQRARRYGTVTYSVVGIPFA